MRLPTREVYNHITHTLQLWKRKSVHPCQKSPSNHSRLPTPENVVCLFDGAKVSTKKIPANGNTQQGKYK